MRKLVVAEMVSLDGKIADQAGTTNFIYPFIDDEFQKHILAGQATVDTFLLGRVTYETLAAFWPNTKTSDNNAADFMNSVPKVVVSKTLRNGEWKPVRIINGGIPEEIQKLKNADGKDITVLGSARLVQSLAEYDLIDEYNIALIPVVLGAGTPLFQNLKEQLNLQLSESEKLRSGVIWSSYRPKRK